MTTPISVAELAARLHQVQIIDVRRRPAFDASSHMVTGAVWRNPDEAAQWAANIDRSRPVVVYCVHGHEVSQGCADWLEKSGIDVRYLIGGFAQWVLEKQVVVVKNQTGDAASVGGNAFL